VVCLRDVEVITKFGKTHEARRVDAEGGGEDTACYGESASDDNMSREEARCLIHLCNSIWHKPFSEMIRCEDEWL